jgi:hypothetical protein
MTSKKDKLNEQLRQNLLRRKETAKNLEKTPNNIGKKERGGN